MPAIPCSQLEGDYEDLDAFEELRKSSLLCDEDFKSNPLTDSSEEYDYAAVSTKSAVSSHGDNSKEIGCSDCAAYNVLAVNSDVELEEDSV